MEAAGGSEGRGAPSSRRLGLPGDSSDDENYMVTPRRADTGTSSPTARRLPKQGTSAAASAERGILRASVGKQDSDDADDAEDIDDVGAASASERRGAGAANGWSGSAAHVATVAAGISPTAYGHAPAAVHREGRTPSQAGPSQ